MANVSDRQTQSLNDALGYLAEARTPGEFADLTYQWDEPFDWACYLRDVEEMVKTEGQPIQDWTPKD